jgi:dienelactone hydrolase
MPEIPAPCARTDCLALDLVRLVVAANTQQGCPSHIKAPLLVAQGANDPRVNRGESEQIVEALRKRGVTVEYLLQENEGHGFLNEENQIEFYETMEKFSKVSSRNSDDLTPVSSRPRRSGETNTSY